MPTPHYRGAHAAGKVARASRDFAPSGRAPAGAPGEAVVSIRASRRSSYDAGRRREQPTRMTHAERVGDQGLRFHGPPSRVPGDGDAPRRGLSRPPLLRVRRTVWWADADVFSDTAGSRFATPRPVRHGSARLFHIHYKPLYRAIGEPNNRHRRPTALPRAIERLMLLDAVLADRERDVARDRAGQTGLFHAHASRPTAGSSVADVPRGGCRDGPVLSGEAADWARPRRPDARLSGPVTQDVPIDFRLSRAARRGASRSAGVDRAPARATARGERRRPAS